VLGQHGAEIACVVLEPVMGSAGIVASPPGFLDRVQEAAHRAGALFILDEVICFRLSTGGAQKLYGIEPDLTLFGKLIGGGLPVGAVGGREEHLAVCDPRAPRMFHSGTFNGNPLTTAAGVVSVRELTQERINGMEQWATELATALAKAAEKLGLPFSVNRTGSLMNLFFTETAPAATLARTDHELISKFHLASLNRGLFFAPRGFIAMSTVLSRELIGEVIERATGALKDLASEQA
jgi:glutamate-1-semialdehyde 2,1-aminomutase